MIGENEMNIAVIFAGGVGRRMNSRGIPKQFLKVNGVPIIIHTLQVFEHSKEIDKIVIACIDEYIKYLQSLISLYHIKKVASVVKGGSTGQQSIYNGLYAASLIAKEEKSVVLLHDGVRPLIDNDLISRNIESVHQFGSAISCVPAKETVVIVNENGEISETTDRSLTCFARAPQSFWLDEILYYHNKAREEKLEFIDSCTLMLYYKKALHTVETSSQNIKITTPDDFYIFKALLSAKENAQILGVE